MEGIYNSGTYLDRNPTWHAEDNSYKVRLVGELLRRNATTFTSCADVGCGAGGLIQGLAAQFPNAQFTGFDISNDASHIWPQECPPNVRFVVEDYVASARVSDLVLCMDVFEHVDDYIGFLRALRARGSQFVFKIPLDLCVAKLITGGLRYAREQVGHLHYFNRYTALETLRYCGYTIEDEHLAPGFAAGAPRTLRQALAFAPRALISLFGARVGAALGGGYTLMVLAH